MTEVVPLAKRTSNIKLAHLFEAPARRVFRAWTDDAEARFWFPVVAGAELVCAEANVRKGGKYKYTMRVEDIDELVMHGKYRVCDEPSKLIFTMRFDSSGDFEPVPKTTVAVEFEDHDTRTQVLLDHSGLQAETESSVSREWRRAFARLASRIV